MIKTGLSNDCPGFLLKKHLKNMGLQSSIV